MRNGQPIEEIKGIGEKTGKLYRKLGIETAADLLSYYPRQYDAMEPPAAIGQLKENSIMAVKGCLEKPAGLLRLQGLQLVNVTIKDLTGTLSLVWYNMPFMRTTLKTGVLYVFRGRVVRKRNRLTMEQPEVFSEEQYGELVHTMRPVYSQTRGLGNKAITRAVAAALKVRELEREYMPMELRTKYKLAEYNYAIEHIHFPADMEELLAARRRLVFDEFFLFLIGIRRMKENRVEKRSEFVIPASAEVERLKESLPYPLTGAQQRALTEIVRDLSGGLCMNRLVQGDVGSGKTILAILALLEAAYAGFQGALMAPTEVLAKQHFETMEQLFAEHEIKKKPILLTGSMTAKEKRTAYAAIKNHEADIVIGTHALIQEKVEYDNLALVITDEQHRFGVGQREALSRKNPEKMPHILVMSATPIPRTLAIILYGDLDISVIDELPARRLPIRNCVVGISYRPKAYQFIEKQVLAGHQAYVICPMVEESEMIEAENVLDYTKALKKELPSDITVEYLHGKLKGKEKNKIMERFAAGEIQVLVSTTVIEVGVNVPNATVMMIENAERFGLAQLHQLRGRVGRGDAQSYCIMVNTSEDEETGKRLEILNKSNDGFFIASEDLKLRGPGDLFGIRQSGDLEFKLADIFTDAELLKTVSEEVDHLLRLDPELEREEHQELGRKLKQYLEKSYDCFNL